jgi:hypothetical protein
MAEVFGGVEFEFCYAPDAIPADICVIFQLFCTRYKELRANMVDLRGPEARFAMNFTKDQGQVTANGRSKFNPHRLKGLYLDYRPFAAQGEITHFGKVCNLVKKHFPGQDVSELIDMDKAIWKADHLSEWHGQTFDEITETFFNAALFHTDIRRQADLAELTSAFDDLALQSILFLGVDWRLAAIRNIAFRVGACTEDHQAVRVPLGNKIQWSGSE